MRGQALLSEEKEEAGVLVYQLPPIQGECADSPRASSVNCRRVCRAVGCRAVVDAGVGAGSGAHHQQQQQQLRIKALHRRARAYTSKKQHQQALEVRIDVQIEG